MTLQVVRPQHFNTSYFIKVSKVNPSQIAQFQAIYRHGVLYSVSLDSI